MDSEMQENDWRGFFERQIALDRGRAPLPPRDKPCGDCAVTGGLYTEISCALAEQPEDVQRAVSDHWFCHDDRNKACRGNINTLATLRRKREVDPAHQGAREGKP